MHTEEVLVFREICLGISAIIVQFHAVYYCIDTVRRIDISKSLCVLREFICVPDFSPDTRFKRKLTAVYTYPRSLLLAGDRWVGEP